MRPARRSLLTGVMGVSSCTVPVPCDAWKQRSTAPRGDRGRKGNQRVARQPAHTSRPGGQLQSVERMTTDRRSWVRIPPLRAPPPWRAEARGSAPSCARPTTQRALRARGRCGREGGGWPGQRRTPRGGSGQQSARGTHSRGRRNIGEEGSGESVQGRRLQTELGSGTRRSASATWPIGSIAPGRSPSDARRAERPRR